MLLRPHRGRKGAFPERIELGLSPRIIGGNLPGEGAVRAGMAETVQTLQK
jgi:hypothetical protein